jgi:hypothetical protein
MSAPTARVAPVVALVERSDDGRLEIAVELALEGTRTRVATWSADDVADGPPAVAVARSPDRLGVAVLVGSGVSRVDLQEGTVSTVEVESLPGGDDPEVVWDEGGPRVLRVETESPRRLPLTDGRVLALDAPVWSDDGFSGGDQNSSAGLMMPAGSSPEDVVRARDELHASLHADASVERRSWARVEGRHAPAVLFDEVASGTLGTTNVHWPVSEGRSGTLVRASSTRLSGGGAADTTIERPWFVGRDGAVRRLDVRLGNAPLCELPDGRWLLPGADALWCDAGNEPLHALGLDGRLSPWTADTAVSTEGLLRAVAPDLLPPDPPENLDDWPWLTAARATDDGVVLLITGPSWFSAWDPDLEEVWAVVGLRADGRGAPILHARGRRTATRFAAVAL